MKANHTVESFVRLAATVPADFLNKFDGAQLNLIRQNEQAIRNSLDKNISATLGHSSAPSHTPPRLGQ